jgi:hypothetical protein
VFALFSIPWRATRGFGRTSALYAAFLLGILSLTYYAAYARPDGVAVALAGLALGESVRRGRVGFSAAVVFAIAAWLKPNVVGCFAGAMIAEVVVHRARVARATLGVLFVSVPAALVLGRASGGTWVTHLAGSTFAPMRLAHFIDHMESRFLFFAPTLVLAGWAACKAMCQRASGATHAFFAVMSSAGFTFLTLPKVGSAGNYWMEPCLAALVAFAHAPLPISWRSPSFATFVFVQCLWVDVATVRGALEGFSHIEQQAEFLKRVRATCDGLILSDDAGLEMRIPSATAVRISRCVATDAVG